MMMPSSGMDWKMVRGTSPVPGGMSTNMKSTSPQITSVQNHGIGVVFQQQIDGHHVNSGLGAHREKPGVAAGGLFRQTECPGGGGTGDIRIQNGGFVAAAAGGNGQQGGDQGFADAALAADHADDSFDMAQGIGFFVQVLRLTAGAVAGAGRAVMGTFAHNDEFPF